MAPAATRPTSAVERIAKEIVTYLDQHPRAADTASGIRRWWLRSRDRAVTAEVVCQALEALQASGLVTKTALEDGTVLYARGTRGTWSN